MSTQWEDAAREVASALAADAVEREAKGGEPRAEVDLLRAHGLLTVPVGDWPLVHRVLAEVAAADASVGHLLGYHYLHVWRLGLFGRPEYADEARRATAEHGWFWAGVANPRDDALVMSEVDGGYLVSGRKMFATGASVADRLVVSAVHGARKVTFVCPGDAPGLRPLGDWDNLGQRLSASGGVEFTDVFVPEHDILGAQPDPADPRYPMANLPALAFQLVLSRVLTATARGALATAADYTRRFTRAWPASGVEKAVDDPHTLAAYGVLTARTDAADLLVDRAAAAFAAADAEGPALTPEQRGATGLAIASAKALASEVALEVTGRVFELTGARATANRYGLDRFWRNARTLTLHDPAVYKAAEVGRHLLTGELPPVTGYS
ncbi:acyl-CoA dehydrogenase family protein [Actinokineospora fastidiosa]|uniref:Monooxygenase n=1 Tax=Actinokineospora fastidiosa TaxID=1816 RepID=A0A918LHG7_9PSEU|nr:acyl-CoA dehydrogenase family protein [Actinokineospora fastidiosa]GGS47890.1 putative monooxygenase [Actinokineospora fastidiosa]